LNATIRLGLRWGVGPRHTYLLTVRGRRTGRPYSTPVTLVEGTGRYLVAPYGEVGWVRNARVAGRVTLTRGRMSQEVALEPLTATASGPVLKEYARTVRVARPYFAASHSDPQASFAAEAERHPVFRLQTAGGAVHR
jgi:deazaflavin-dependent oxidoreductase (nitroreductase family)